MRQLAEFMDYVPLDDVASGVKVKSIFSFTISPDMKQQGTASAMLEQVRSDAENVRTEFVEAYPYKESVFMSSDFISIKSKKVKVMRKKHKNNRRVLARRFGFILSSLGSRQCTFPQRWGGVLTPCRWF